MGWGMEQRANYMFLVYAKRFAFTDNCWGEVVWSGMEAEMSNRECGEKGYGAYAKNIIFSGIGKTLRREYGKKYMKCQIEEWVRNDCLERKDH